MYYELVTIGNSSIAEAVRRAVEVWERKHPNVEPLSVLVPAGKEDEAQAATHLTVVGRDWMKEKVGVGI